MDKPLNSMLLYEKSCATINTINIRIHSALQKETHAYQQIFSGFSRSWPQSCSCLWPSLMNISELFKSLFGHLIFQFSLFHFLVSFLLIPAINVTLGSWGVKKFLQSLYRSDRLHRVNSVSSQRNQSLRIEFVMKLSDMSNTNSYLGMKLSDC